MQTFIRVAISVIVGFLLTGPITYAYDVLKWPTFHSWVMLHYGIFSAWPTLSIIVFLALGYVPLFRRAEDTPLLIVGLAGGLFAAGFLGGSSSYLSASGTYGLLAGTAAIVAVLSFFAKIKLGLAVLVVLPVILLGSQFGGLMSPPRAGFLFCALAGWGLGSLASAILKGPRPAGQSFPSRLVASARGLGEAAGRFLGARRD